MSFGLDRFRVDWSDWRIGIFVERKRYGWNVWVCFPVLSALFFWRSWP